MALCIEKFNQLKIKSNLFFNKFCRDVDIAVCWVCVGGFVIGYERTIFEWNWLGVGGELEYEYYVF